MKDDITEAELEAQEIDIDHADQQVAFSHILQFTLQKTKTMKILKIDLSHSSGNTKGILYNIIMMENWKKVKRLRKQHGFSLSSVGKRF